MAQVSEKENVFQPASTEKERDFSPVAIVERFTDDPQFTIETYTVGKDGSYTVGTIGKGHEDDWNRPFDVELTFDKVGEVEWALNNATDSSTRLVYIPKDGVPVQLGADEGVRGGKIDKLDPADNLYILNQDFFDIIQKTNTLDAKSLSTLMHDQTPFTDFIRLSYKGDQKPDNQSIEPSTDETSLPDEPDERRSPTNFIYQKAITGARPRLAIEALRHVDTQDHAKVSKKRKTAQSNKARYLTSDELDVIRGVVKVGKSGTTFHHEDGKLLSRSELLSIYENVIAQQAEQAATAAPEVDSTNYHDTTSEGDVLVNPEPGTAAYIIPAAEADTVSSENTQVSQSGKELVLVEPSSKELARLERVQSPEVKHESLWRRARNGLRHGYGKAGYWLGEAERRLGEALPKSDRRINESPEEYDKRMKRRGVVLAVGVLAAFFVLRESPHISEAIFGSGASSGSGNHIGSTGTDIFHHGGETQQKGLYPDGLHNLLNNQDTAVPPTLHAPPGPNVGGEVLPPSLHTPEVSLYANQYPWDWARDAFPGQNATTVLHHLTDLAQAHGHVVEWLPARGGGEYIQVDGSSNTVMVLNILRPLAG